MPSNALDWRWARGRPDAVAQDHPETLKNQRDVVSEEVRVNVLNQPYGAFSGSACAEGEHEQ
jgi:hypothetical protein